MLDKFEPDTQLTSNQKAIEIEAFIIKSLPNLFGFDHVIATNILAQFKLATIDSPGTTQRTPFELKA